MNVRAKFKVQSRFTADYGPFSTPQTTVLLAAQYDPNLKEDQSYAKATPTGQLSMVVDNPSALLEFTVGRVFYVDFTPSDGGGAAI